MSTNQEKHEKPPLVDAWVTERGKGVTGPLETQKAPLEGKASKPDDGSVTFLLKKFCQETSAHGLAGVHREAHYALKLFWVALFFVAIGGNLFHLSTLVRKFNERQTQEMTSLSHMPVPFPDVTMCNANPISPSNLAEVLSDRRSRAYQYQLALQRDYDSEWVARRIGAQVGFYENIGSDEAKAISHHAKDFIASCHVRGSPCDADVLRHHMDPLYYSCYTFKGDTMSSSFVVAGSANGLTVTLYLEAFNGTVTPETYCPSGTVSNQVGVRVIIHPPGTLPQPHTHGFDIMPGHSTSVALEIEEIERLDEPYGECTENVSLRELPQFSYDLPGCLEMCMQTQNVDKCGCQTGFHPLSATAVTEEKCGTFQGKTPEQYERDTICEFNSWKDFSNTSKVRQSCGCPAQCHYFKYTPVISEASWPDPASQDSFYQHVVESRPDRDQLKSYNYLKNVLGNPISTPMEKRTIIGLNFARLNVYFKDLEVVRRVEVPSYTLSNLFSDFGGTMGLWVGISVLSIVEILQFVILLLRLISSNLSRQIKQIKVGDVEKDGL